MFSHQTTPSCRNYEIKRDLFQLLHLFTRVTVISWCHFLIAKTSLDEPLDRFTILAKISVSIEKIYGNDFGDDVFVYVCFEKSIVLTLWSECKYL